MKSIEEKMQEKIKASGFKQSHIAKETGIKSVNLSLSLNRKRRLSSDEFISLCSFLGLNLSDFNDDELSKVRSQGGINE